MVPTEITNADGSKQTVTLGGLQFGDELEYPDYSSSAQSGRGSMLRSTSIPSKYDSREHNAVTGVRSQGSNGLCWAFSSFAALEGNAKINGVISDPDFSEAHMAYSMTSDVNTEQRKEGEPGRSSPKDGGSYFLASSYLMRGTGLNGIVNESDDVYSRYGLPSRSAEETRNKPKSYTAHNIGFINGSAKVGTDSEREAVKKAIMQYGSVATYMHWEDTTPTEEAGPDDTQSYRASTCSYYYNGTEASNHGVILIGWDDTYSTENFHSFNRPSTPGAWLAKNSWNSTWGDNGYFWISYEDSKVPTYATFFDEVTPYDSDVRTYESDYLFRGGATGNESVTERYVAKVFNAEDDEMLTSVRIEVATPNLAVSVDCIADFDSVRDNFTNTGYPSFSAKGSVSTTYPGWYTIELDSPVRLYKDKDFAVVVHCKRTRTVKKSRA